MNFNFILIWIINNLFLYKIILLLKTHLIFFFNQCRMCNFKINRLVLCFRTRNENQCNMMNVQKMRSFLLLNSVCVCVCVCVWDFGWVTVTVWQEFTVWQKHNVVFYTNISRLNTFCSFNDVLYENDGVCFYVSTVRSRPCLSLSDTHTHSSIAILTSQPVHFAAFTPNANRASNLRLSRLVRCLNSLNPFARPKRIGRAASV